MATPTIGQSQPYISTNMEFILDNPLAKDTLSSSIDFSSERLEEGYTSQPGEPRIRKPPPTHSMQKPFFLTLPSDPVTSSHIEFNHLNELSSAPGNPTPIEDTTSQMPSSGTTSNTEKTHTTPQHLPSTPCKLQAVSLPVKSATVTGKIQKPPGEPGRSPKSNGYSLELVLIEKLGWSKQTFEDLSVS